MLFFREWLSENGDGLSGTSGFCDMFDGKIARTKKNRTEVEKKFGIQIDSLADIICFGVGPSLIAYRMGMNHGIGVTILMFYVLAGLIRLAWYNVSEEIRQEETTENRECYQGLPITSMAVALPILYVFRPILGKDFIIALHALVLIIGLLFITNFRLRKPKKLGQTVMVVIGRTGSAAWTAYLVENSCKVRWNRERIYERLNIK